MGDELELVVLAGPDDPALKSDSFQRDLQAFTEHLRAEGVEFQPRFSFRDSAGDPNRLALTTVTFLGQYAIPLGSAALGGLGTALVAWIKASAGRKVKVKIGDRSIEAGTVEEVERLMPQVLDAKPAKAKKKS